MRELILAMIGLALVSLPLAVGFMLLTDKTLFACWMASGLFTTWKLILDYAQGGK